MGTISNLFPLFCAFLFLLLWGQSGMQVEGGEQVNEFLPTKLFVFGDSYVDTGNLKMYPKPYGITFPGKPTGRASDGRLLTDYLANFLKLKKLPVPYMWWIKHRRVHDLKYGMNFAFGGSGVFGNASDSLNMTIQIDYFEQLLKNNSVYNASDLDNSMAYVSVSGNDYVHYVIDHPSMNFWDILGLLPYTWSLVNQIANNLLRIKNLGVKKIVVSDLPPLGCVPLMTNLTDPKFEQCNGVVNNVVVYIHNLLLNIAVNELNKERNDQIKILGINKSFNTVLNNPSDYGITESLKPCCVGASGGICWDVDSNNVTNDTVCDKPTSSFFWDIVHPTQAGWEAVTRNLETTNALHQLFYKTTGHAGY